MRDSAHGSPSCPNFSTLCSIVSSNSLSSFFLLFSTMSPSPISCTWSRHATTHDADHLSGFIGRFYSKEVIASWYAITPSTVSILVNKVSYSELFSFFLRSNAFYCSVWLCNFNPLKRGTTFLRCKTNHRGSFLTLLISSKSSEEKSYHLFSLDLRLSLSIWLTGVYLRFWHIPMSDRFSDF